MARLLRRTRRRLRLVVLAVRGVAATVIAILLRAPGQRLGVYGRWLGIRALLSGRGRVGRDLVLTPLHIVRYWELPFALRHLPQATVSCLDVASPRLLSLYLAGRRRSARIRVINPDPADVAITKKLARVAGVANIEVERLAVADLTGETATYDAIWSISVIEHIPDDGDRAAVRLLYDALKPGGRLLLTVPVDRHAWDEFRETDTYHLGLPRGPQGYFFQRWYDEEAIRAGLLAAVPEAGGTIHTEWFGERRAGHFAEYEQRWIREGHAVTVDDPLEIARHYRTFGDWSEMPGQGVCGIVITRPR